MSITVSEFTNTLTRVTAGGTGSAALSKFNNPLSQIETHLNTLATRIANQNGKSAIIRKYVPMSADVFIGALVYFNSATGHSRFEPALAALLGDPGDQGNSVEAPSSRVEGIVLSVDSSADNTNTVTGTLLCGGYYESTAVMNGCAGTVAAGTYYLSPTSAGHAVTDTSGHLRQPALSSYGGGKFSMSLFYMAHDNHFHGSCELGSNWTAVSTLPSGVTEAPTGAHFWYNGAADPGYVNIGELSSRTTAVFLYGVLQLSSDNFIVSDGYLWWKGTTAPASGTVAVFNSYPFAYDSAVVRSVESMNDALTVTNKNGLIQLTANDFVSGSVTNSGYAVSALSGNTFLMTPVVSGMYAGPGIALTRGTDGTVTVSSSDRIGVPVDAYSIHHRQTNQTSDGKFMYLTFPSGRSSELVITYPVNDVPDTTTLRAYTWCEGVGTGATFNVSFYWTPRATASAASVLPTTALQTATMTFSGTGTAVTYAESTAGADFTGGGMLSAVISISSAPTTDIRLLRTGFRFSVVSSAVATVSTDDVTSLQQLVNSASAASAISKYSCLKIDSTGASVCTGASSANCNQCIGIALEAASAGGQLRYIMQGVIQDTSFSFTPGGALYIAADGTLTQTNPQSTSGVAYVQRVGTALTSAIIQISIETGTVKEA